MSRMSRRAFLGFRFSEEDAGTRDVPGGVPPETPLPPEFSPAMLRAEAERLGLDPDRIGAGELASAVMRAMPPGRSRIISPRSASSCRLWWPRPCPPCPRP